MKDLKRRLAQCDHRSADDLKEIYESFKNQKSFNADTAQETLIHLLLEPELQIGSSWLLKHGWEQKDFVPSATHSKSLIKLLPQLNHWEAKLHILQSVSYLPLDKSIITTANQKRLYAFLQNNLAEENKFLRAWTYHGFYELAQNHPQYTDEVKQLFRRAMLDEAASVKARLRNIIKSGFSIDD